MPTSNEREMLSSNEALKELSRFAILFRFDFRLFHVVSFYLHLFFNFKVVMCWNLCIFVHELRDRVCPDHLHILTLTEIY